MQIAFFDKKIDFERYWYSEETAEARVRCAGWYQVPLLPIWYQAVGFGVIAEAIEDSEAA